MLSEIQDAIITALAGLAPTVAKWQGQVEEALTRPHLLPALWVSFAGARYDEQEVLGGGTPPVRHTQRWRVMVVSGGAKGRVRANDEVLTLVEAVLSTVSSLPVLTAGRLWPVAVELLIADDTITAYGVEFVLGEVFDIQR